jgi:hypothetical protein
MRKVQFNPRTTAKDLVKMLEETGTLLIYVVIGPLLIHVVIRPLLIHVVIGPLLIHDVIGPS